MKTLREALNVNNKINSINSKSIKEAIKISLKEKKYKFYLNSELIDIKDRFRIFDYNNEPYIIKKVSIEDGKKEVELASKANEYLNDICVNQFNLKVVLPSIEIIEDVAYIVTKYEGVSLQECLYSNKYINPLSLEDLFLILDKLMELGILYRGFLPRNTIIKKNNIFLLNWEDVYLCKQDNEIYFSKLWETNFLLNWSYFFNINDLSENIHKYTNIKNKE
jgi:hypothetical protein